MRLLLLALLFVLPACGGPLLGSVTPGFGQTVADTPTTREVRVYLEPGGGIRGLSIYHLDAEAIPAAVRTLGASRFPGRKIVYYETEWYADGTQVFEVEYALEDGRKGEIAARVDGSLVYVERPMPSVPEPARRAAMEAVAGGRIIEGDRRQGPGIDHFILKLDLRGRVHVLHIDAQGQVLQHGIRVPAKIEVPFK
ncbi:MAG: hypothetical protein ACI9U2_002737 [Bradymonadia bacterium]|jgi:hypothetical protein